MCIYKSLYVRNKYLTHVNKMNKQIRKNNPNVVTVLSTIARISSNPIDGNHIFIHEIPETAMKKISELLDKPIQSTGTFHYVECSKARDGTKLFFVGVSQ